MAKTHDVKWKKEGYLGILMLNSPPENYLKNPEFVQISHLREWLSNDIKALIITGTGRHFSAGADLKNMIGQTATQDELRQSLVRGNQLLNFIADLEIPVLAAISGVCFGGGLEIALACDIRICTGRSLFAFPEINQDLIPGMGGLRRLEKICGRKATMEILFSGDTLNAHKALDLKIVDKIIPANNYLDECKQLLEGWVKDRSLKVIHKLMRSFRNAENLDFNEALQKDLEMFCDLAQDYAMKNRTIDPVRSLTGKRL
jgi:enoyl-CoA hydratase/carnithine racemase